MELGVPAQTCPCSGTRAATDKWRPPPSLEEASKGDGGRKGDVWHHRRRPSAVPVGSGGHVTRHQVKYRHLADFLRHMDVFSGYIDVA